ncbi:DUF1871 family protein [Bacillus sp. CGMCC 1.16541]|uniref:DUF1871 family protein n=1 Tax=Bacillus sp. CGMCC 1.16541 TaxID=2185143 RepID=UPI000D726E2D|nr:DUF1871 family protein [Bacillus sp. CGMCC 1.16541]
MNEAQQSNVKIMENLLNWDPLGYGKGSYETEVVDVLQAVHVYDSVSVLAQKIQDIYEFSFEELIPLSTCERKAQELLFIKNSGTCER